MNAGGVVAIMPTLALLAEDATNGNPIGLATQLGVGAVLVAFAVWLQTKFRSENKEDLTAAEARFDLEVKALREELSETRKQLIAALTKSNPPKDI